MSGFFINYRFLCKMLSPFVTESGVTELHRQIRQSEIDWTQVLSIANQHLISASLWTSARAKHLDPLLPEEVRDYLEELYNLNHERNMHLQRQATEIIRALNEAGIEPLLIKGIVLLAHSFYPAFGDRIMNDLDIVVPHSAFHSALDVLYKLEYRESSDYPAHFAPPHHWIPLVRDWEYGSVELHRDPLHPIAAGILPTADVWRQSERYGWEGLRARIPCPTHFILLGFLHSAIVDKRYSRYQIDLKWLADSAAILSAESGRINWSEIEKRLAPYGLTSAWHSQRLSASRLWGTVIPALHGPGLLSRAHAGVSIAALRHPMLGRFLGSNLDLLRVAHSFSAIKICELYQCEPRTIPLLRNRLRLFFRYAFLRKPNDTPRAVGNQENQQ